MPISHSTDVMLLVQIVHNNIQLTYSSFRNVFTWHHLQQPWGTINLCWNAGLYRSVLPNWSMAEQRFPGLYIQFRALFFIEWFVFPAQIRVNQHFQITHKCTSIMKICLLNIFTMAHENQPKIIAGIIDQRIAVSLIKGTWWLNQKL